MAKTSPATRANRSLVALLVVALLTGGAAAVFGNTDTSSPIEPVPSTAPVLPSDIVGLRPAETSYTWFDHGMSIEQYDYPMKELTCQNLEKEITPDICGVATTSHGSFMLAGTEGYWDKSETDDDGMVNIPFDMTAFVFRTDMGITRAAGILDGYFEKPYTSNEAKIDLYKATINKEEVLVLIKHLVDEKKNSVDFAESLHVIAASPTGVPTVVATYEGVDMQVASTGESIIFSSRRYKATLGAPEAQWFSRVVLSPSQRDPYSWNESVTARDTKVVMGTGLTLLASHKFAATKSAKPSQA